MVLECSLCFESVEEAAEKSIADEFGLIEATSLRATKCGHIVHEVCLKKCFSQSQNNDHGSCPQCGNRIARGDCVNIYPNIIGSSNEVEAPKRGCKRKDCLNANRTIKKQTEQLLSTKHNLMYFQEKLTETTVSLSVESRVLKDTQDHLKDTLNELAALRRKCNSLEDQLKPSAPAGPAPTRDQPLASTSSSSQKAVLVVTISDSGDEETETRR